MKKNLFLLLTCSWYSLNMSADNLPMKNDVIWFDKPIPSSVPPVWEYFDNLIVAGAKAQKNKDIYWENLSLPIGNGNIGANIMGSVETERITFNEKTLWRGGPNNKKGADYYWNVNKESVYLLSDIRKNLSDGNNKKAQELLSNNFNGKVSYEANGEDAFRFGSFTTAGEFRIKTGIGDNNVTDYVRSLSLDSALAKVSFVYNGVRYERSSFISHPDNIMVLKFTATDKQTLEFSYLPNPLMEGKFKKSGKDELLYEGKLKDNGMKFVLRIKTVVNNGFLNVDSDGRINVLGAENAMFLITADTDYKINFNPDFSDEKAYVGVNPKTTTAAWMRSVAGLSYGDIYAKHYEDYSSLYNRTTFEINPKWNSKGSQLPMPERLESYRQGVPDYELETLYYQFGRYLLISSSRPGNMPANLQGLWHNNIDGPWRVDYHNNINIQMNYWLACPTNLAECELPLFDYLKTLVKPGERTAQSYFGARGWTTSISGNIFGFTAPMNNKNMSWNFSPVAGPWLATHIWDYYDYTRDKKFLQETGYELIKSSAEFAVDYLWKKNDTLYTASPSTSPEHGPIDEGTAFSHGVIREILSDAIEASEELNVDSVERDEWKYILEHIAPYKIGRYGQLMEWSADIDNPYDEHRHVNQLFGLHPGHSISPLTTPKLAKAARVALEHRGDGATGWSMGWKLNQWARLHDGNRAYKLYGNLLKNGTNDNLWDTHPPFQIDGNFGGTAGVTEMLIQCHAGFIHVLPALPDVWHEGKLTGIRVRGNFIVDIEWRDNNLERLILYSGSGENCILKYKGMTMNLSTEKGKRYEIVVKDKSLVNIKR